MNQLEQVGLGGMRRETLFSLRSIESLDWFYSDRVLVAFTARQTPVGFDRQKTIALGLVAGAADDLCDVAAAAAAAAAAINLQAGVGQS